MALQNIPTNTSIRTSNYHQEIIILLPQIPHQHMGMTILVLKFSKRVNRPFDVADQTRRALINIPQRWTLNTSCFLLKYRTIIRLLKLHNINGPLLTRITTITHRIRSTAREKMQRPVFSQRTMKNTTKIVPTILSGTRGSIRGAKSQRGESYCIQLRWWADIVACTGLNRFRS